jgi:CRP/FNR family transcriptional regulator
MLGHAVIMPASNTAHVRELLSAIPMFQELTPELRDRVASLSTLQVAPKGDELWHAGDDAELLTVIVSGLVKVVRHADSGDVILELFGAGDTVGAVAVYHHVPYPASAITMQPTTLLRLPRRDWLDLIEHDPVFARGMMAELSRLNMSLTRKFAGMHGTRVSERIAALFLTLAERMGRDTAQGIEIPIELSRQEIASMVGTTIESAIRVMSRWNQDGVLLTQDHHFVIPDRERLASESAGDTES